MLFRLPLHTLILLTQLLRGRPAGRIELVVILGPDSAGHVALLVWRWNLYKEPDGFGCLLAAAQFLDGTIAENKHREVQQYDNDYIEDPPFKSFCR